MGRFQLRFKVIIAASANGMPPQTNHKKEKQLITNAEVLEALKLQMPAVKRNKKRGSTHCEWIRDNVSDFLSSTSCRGEPPNPPRPDLFSVLPDTLTDEEKLQIVNIIPTELVELFLIIDNINDRFTESQQEQLLALIQGIQAPTNEPHDSAEPDETYLDVKIEPMGVESKINDSMDADATPTSQVTPDPVFSGSPVEDVEMISPNDATLETKQVESMYGVNGGCCPLF